MAGHSKWANIKHKKAANDKKRGKIWSKLIREVTVAAREGGGDPDSNPRLRLAVDKATSANMPKDTVKRAIERGSGGGDGENYDEIRYEGYGPGGTAVIVDCMTDNRNRTASEVRHAFSKHGGNLGTDGSVSYLFRKQGIISYAPGTDEDAVMEAALEAAARRNAWVSSVRVQKIWPDTVSVTVQEYQPVAHWNSGTLVSSNGTPFSVPEADELQGLPWLQGPEGRLGEVLEAWTGFDRMLVPLGLEIRRITLDRRGAWSLMLSNGTQLQLGRDDTVERLERLLSAWDTLMQGQDRPPAGVDLRLWDDRIDAIDYDEPTDLVAITVEAFTARRAY